MLRLGGVPHELDGDAVVVQAKDEGLVVEIIEFLSDLDEPEAPPVDAPDPADRLERPTQADRAQIVDALRQLKMLHDEGILTDVEYESKRQTLANRL